MHLMSKALILICCAPEIDIFRMCAAISLHYVVITASHKFLPCSPRGFGHTAECVCTAMPQRRSSRPLSLCFDGKWQLQGIVLSPVSRYHPVTFVSIAIMSCRWFTEWRSSSPPATLFGCCITPANKCRLRHRLGQGGTAPCQRGSARVPRRCLSADACHQRLRTVL